MPEADLDAVIRQLAKQQNKSLMGGGFLGCARYMAKAAKAKDKDAKTRLKLMARRTMDHGLAAAKRLQNSADNTADSYARAIKNAAEEIAAMTPAKQAGRKAVKKAGKKAT
jgi:hypothetical protein